MRPPSTGLAPPARWRWGSASGAEPRRPTDIGATAALLWVALAGVCAPRPTTAQQTVGPRRDVQPVAEMLEQLITHEMADKGIPAISIALVDGPDVVWARGYGLARPEDSVPATAETVYRIASVSKLFTALALMQLVEGGAIALDSPLATYLPELRPTSRWPGPITPRQLLTHRSGLVREPPVGGYGDRGGATLAATVSSLNQTALVYPPDAWTKYSNAAVSVAGYLVERERGEPFATALRRHVLEPLGMNGSSFATDTQVSARLATGTVWTPHGRFRAPVFEFGIAPAVGMYSTVLDLGSFMTGVFAGGAGPGGRVLDPRTLQSMWRMRHLDSTVHSGYGLGFVVTELDGRRRVGHDGAVYGYATTLAFLPDERVGVAVIATLDLATGVTSRLADAALTGLLAVRAGNPIPKGQVTRAVPPAVAHRLAGRYRGLRRRVDLIERGGELFLAEGTLGLPQRLRFLGDALVVDDRTDFGARLQPAAGGAGGAGRLVVRRDTLVQQPLYRPAPPPDRWKGLVGEYRGDDSLAVMFVFERQGWLFVQLGWVFASALTEGPNGTLRFPSSDLFAGEPVVFHRDSTGRAVTVEAAGGVFRRHETGPDDGHQLRVRPVRPVEDLLRAARQATPPPEPGNFRRSDLVDLAGLDPSLRFDIRYATTDNFLGAVFYPTAQAFLQRPAAEALVRAHQRIRKSGYGLVVHDGYRPWFVTKVFWDATPGLQRWLVADPGRGSRHNRGSAVDVSLYDLATGEIADMGGTYDEATTRSSTLYPVPTGEQQWRRELLREALESEGFGHLPEEWWHFDYQDWRRYPILNVPFEELTPPVAPGLVPGDHEFSLSHGGRRRSYLVHVPPRATAGAPLPVLLVFHGGGGFAGDIKRYSRMDAVADREGFVAVYPNGTGRWGRRLLTFNAGSCCGYAQDHDVDDVGFTLALLDDLARRTPVATGRVYATGHSNGSMMAYRVAIAASDRIAAVAGVAGGVVTAFTPTRPMPVLHIHSVDDPRALYQGGLGPPFPLTNRRVQHPAVDSVLAQWRAALACPEQPDVSNTRHATAADGAPQTATLLVWRPCREGAEVAHWKLTGAGHAWPGSDDGRLEKILGPGTTVIDASEEVWRFVSRFSR